MLMFFKRWLRKPRLHIYHGIIQARCNDTYRLTLASAACRAKNLEQAFTLLQGMAEIRYNVVNHTDVRVDRNSVIMIPDEWLNVH
jgi:hypothetical protein